MGAGIFALLGAAGAVAGSAVWLSFLIAGSSVVAAGNPSWAKALGVLLILVMTGLNAIGSTEDLSKAGGRAEAPSELWFTRPCRNDPERACWLGCGATQPQHDCDAAGTVPARLLPGGR